MKSTISLQSSSSKEPEKSVDMMTRPSSISPSTPIPNPISMADGDRPEAATSHSQMKVLADHNKATVCALERAREVEANLDPALPSFVKSVHPTHISGEFRLRFPLRFCNSHIPKRNAIIYLINENQEKYPVNYFKHNNVLGVGGWKQFCFGNKLVEGDALVFQLVKPTEFQVYIIRAYGRGGTGGILSLPSVGALEKQSNLCKCSETRDETANKRQKTLPLAALLQAEQGKSRSDSEGVGSEIMEGNGLFSEPSVCFKDVNDLKNFTVVVNGLNIDSELSDEARTKYYELCCSQKEFLHNNLIQGYNCKLIAGIISQIVSIADDIKASNLRTSRDDFATWYKKLGAFEELGVNVEFLRARIRKLVSIVFEADESVDTKNYREVLVRRTDVEAEIVTVKAKLAELEQAYKSLETGAETLKLKVICHELKYQEALDAPW